MFNSVDMLQSLTFRDKNPALFGLIDFLNQGSQAFEIDDPRGHKLMAEEALEWRLCQQIRGDRIRWQEMIDHRSFDPGGMLTQPGPEVEIGSGGVADPRSFGLVSPFKNIRRMREARFNHIGKLTE